MSNGSERATVAARLGLSEGSVVGELGFDDDVDHDLREQIEAVIGGPILDGGGDEVFDAVVVWWRDGEGDLTDELVDALTPLADDGVIWLATPRSGADGYVDASEVGDAAETAGLLLGASGPMVGDWMLTKLERARSFGRSRR